MSGAILCPCVPSSAQSFFSEVGSTRDQAFSLAGSAPRWGEEEDIFERLGTQRPPPAMAASPSAPRLDSTANPRNPRAGSAIEAAGKKWVSHYFS